LAVNSRLASERPSETFEPGGRCATLGADEGKREKIYWPLNT